ncbi:serine protease, subtilase family protein [Hyalangium minutum]|uniref:Serine protease, subtilase family protein n=1 Tax=Hyalangium minutum TaxID=394096 RepID=A0A085W3C7_9BACT|nr:serine protease, subtilase family protein [Hyalangium minutum]
MSRVEFFLDGNYMTSVTSATYSTFWFTDDFPNGPHVLTAKAYDGDGHVTTSAPVSIIVDNDYVPPAVSIISPAQGASLAGMVSVEASASDDRSVSSVYFYADGTFVKAVYSAPFVLTWDSHAVPNGTHTLTAEARDEQGNRTLSVPVTVTVAQPGSAEYDLGRGVPTCPEGSSICDTAALVQGRGFYGPEPHAPNTIGGSCADGTDNSYRDEQIHWLRVSRSDGLPFAAGRRVRVDVAVEADLFPGYVVELFSATDASAPVWTHLATHRLDWNMRDLQVFSSEYVLPEGRVQAVRANYHYGEMFPTPCSNGPIDDRDDLVFGVGEAVDVAAPTAVITAPVANQQITGTFTVKVAAEDDFNVTRVEVYDGQTLIGTDTTAPFAVAWGTQTAADGTHTLTAKAYDAVGHVGTSAPLSMIVDRNRPGVALTAPARASVVRGVVQLTASASDDRGVTRVEFYEYGYYASALIGTDTTAPYSVPWDTLAFSNVQHGMFARAFDIAGNYQDSEIIGITVDNASPTVVITSPANGAKVSLSTTIQANASDTNGVAQVAFYDGSKLIGTDTTAPYSVTWGLLLVSRGQHTLTARATDLVGNVTTSALVVVTVQ